MPTVALSAKGGPLILHGAYGEVLDRRIGREQAAWTGLRAQLFRYAGILKPIPARRPPESRRHVACARSCALGHDRPGAERLGKEDMRDFLRMLLMNVADVARRASRRRPPEGPARLRRDARQPSRPALADLAARPLLPAGRRGRRHARRPDAAGGRHGRGGRRDCASRRERRRGSVRTDAAVGRNHRRERPRHRRRP